MNRKSDQKRKRTDLEMLGSNSDSDVEILDYKPEVKRMRSAQPVPPRFFLPSPTFFER